VVRANSKAVFGESICKASLSASEEVSETFIGGEGAMNGGGGAYGASETVS